MTNKKNMTIEDIQEEELQYNCNEIKHNLKEGVGSIMEIDGIEYYCRD